MGHKILHEFAAKFFKKLQSDNEKHSNYSFYNSINSKITFINMKFRVLGFDLLHLQTACDIHIFVQNYILYNKRISLLYDLVFVKNSLYIIEKLLDI